MIMPKVAIYIRVSTQEQAQEGYSIPAQKERLMAYCKAKDWSIADIYVDGGFSGANIQRPALQKLIAEINLFDIVLVYKLDRLSRSQKDTLYLIEEVFLPNNVDFVSMNESFDTSTPFGRAMVGILSVFAQLEREQIKERLMMGKIQRAKDGKYSGTKTVPIGYKKVGEHLEIDEYEAMQVRKIYDLYNSGMGSVLILEQLYDAGYTTKYGQWKNTATVNKILTNDLYIGTLNFAGVKVENAFPAIVSKNTWDKAQIMRRNRRKLHNNETTQSLLGGFLYCGDCGARYHAKSSQQMYICYSNSMVKVSLIKNRNCKNKPWKIDLLNAIVDDKVRTLLFDDGYFDSLVSKGEGKKPEVSQAAIEKEALENQVESLERQINRFMDLYQANNIPVEIISKRINQAYEEKKLLEEKLANLPQDEESLSGDDIKELLKNTALVWDLADIPQKRKILATLIDKIIVYPDKIDIKWTFQ